MKVNSNGFLNVSEIYGIPFKVEPVPTTTKEFKSLRSTTKKYIVVHNAGSKADDTTLNKYMAQDDYKIWHFTVDKDSITQGNSIYLSGYHAGDGANGQGNLYGIGIEIADKGDNKECEQSANNAIKLIKFLMDESPFGLLSIKPHQFFSPNKKYCPAWILSNWGWDGFIKRFNEFKPDQLEEAWKQIIRESQNNPEGWINKIEELIAIGENEKNILRFLPQFIENIKGVTL